MQNTVTEKKYNFTSWKRNIADIFLQKKGIHPDDLPDYNYRDFFDEDFSENQTVQAYLLKIDDNHIYDYWLKYIQNKYYQSYNSKLEDSETLRKLY